MYNGLPISRGSGSKGFVQRSLFNRPSSAGFQAKPPHSSPIRVEPRKTCKDILEHEKKRRFEVKLMELRIELEKQGCNSEMVEKIVQQHVDEEKSALAAKAEESKERGFYAEGAEEDRSCLLGKKEMQNMVAKDALGIKEKRKRTRKEVSKLKEITYSEIEFSEELENRLVGFKIVPEKRRKEALANLTCARKKEEGKCRDDQDFAMDIGRKFCRDKAMHQEMNIIEKLHLFEDKYQNRFPQAKLKSGFKTELPLAEKRKRGRQEEDKKRELKYHKCLE